LETPLVAHHFDESHVVVIPDLMLWNVEYFEHGQHLLGAPSVQYHAVAGRSGALRWLRAQDIAQEIDHA
jgi:hypothetical protein